MGRSFFIVNSERKNVNKAQFRKLRDELGQHSLLLEGPCSDRMGSLGDLADDVRRRMNFSTIKHPVGALIATLSPQNLPSSERSWLETPFIIGSEGTCLDAGSVACSDKVAHDNTEVRVADLEELTLMGLALLRRLGVESFYAFSHFDKRNPLVLMAHQLSQGEGRVMNPCILVPGENPQIVMFHPPYIMDYPAGPSIIALEVLDEVALSSFFMIRGSMNSAKFLMKDVKEGNFVIPGEGEFRSMAIGHMLFEGMVSWSLEDAIMSGRRGEMLMNLDMGTLTSVRKVLESVHVHQMTCPSCHGSIASEEILSEHIWRQIAPLIPQMNGVDTDWLRDNFPGQECIDRFDEYRRLAQNMVDHVHPSHGCQDMLEVN